MTETPAIRFRATRAATYRLRAGDLAAAWQRARESTSPVPFGIEFQNDTAPARAGTPHRWVVLAEADYKALLAERDGYAELAGKLGTHFTAEEFAEITGLPAGDGDD
jgi:hypothetical protein